MTALFEGGEFGSCEPSGSLLQKRWLCGGGKALIKTLFEASISGGVGGGEAFLPIWLDIICFGGRGLCPGGRERQC